MDALRRSPRRTLALACASALAVSLAVLIGPACSPDEEPELARASIGPEGGSISGGGLTVEIPPGALAVETEIILRANASSLSRADYAQLGEAITIEPADLRLALPATVSFAGGDAAASVLVATSERTVAHPGNVAYIEYLGEVALASTGTPMVSLVEPELGLSPGQPGGDFVDNLHFELDLQGTHRVDLVVTAWDFSGAQTVLNGMGHCGFKLVQLEGGSLTTGCASGTLTASINAAGDHVSFDVLPLHAPAIDEPVAVSVVAGDEELAYSLGYFRFDTGSCYLEECDGNGSCVDEGGASCECVEGFAQAPEDPLSCECVPQCEGRACGSDSCGGSCGDCAMGLMCVYAEGQCVPEEGGDGDGDPTTTGEGDGDPTGDGDGDPTTTGDGDGDPTGDGDGDPTTGDGDGDGDGDAP